MKGTNKLIKKESLAIGEKGFLIRGVDDRIYFRIYNQNNDGFVDYEWIHYDCEIVIIDKSASLITTDSGDYLDYSTDSMEIVK